MGNGGGAAEVLERVAESGGRLLRVEREPGAGPAGRSRSRVLRLTFDLAVVELRAASAGRGAALEAVTLVPGSAPAPPVSADEEGPWWTLIGHPLTRVATLPDGALRVQFRPDAASPRILLLGAVEGAVAVRTLV